jgi:hypothetical protein
VLAFKRSGHLSRRGTWKYNGNRVEFVSGFTYVGKYFGNILSSYIMAEAMIT